MTDENKSSEEIAWEEMAKLVLEKDVANVEFQVFIRRLEEDVDKAQRRLDVARIIADTCSATKTRKPRRDKGKTRKTKPVDEDEKKQSPGEQS